MQKQTTAASLSIALLLLATSLGAQAQESGLRGLAGFWQPKFGREPFGQPLIDQLPPGTLLINDTGDNELEPGQFAGLRLTQRALDQAENYDPLSMLNPDMACIPPSVAFYMQAPFPFAIDEGRDLIVFRMEYYDLVRVIYLDGRAHPPADPPPTKSGHSVGHWEGEPSAGKQTLVVDTTHIAAGTLMNNGFDHSENLHIVERFQLSPDGSTLWSTQVYEDADTFEGLAARYIAFVREPGGFIYPFECFANYLTP
jgi:hypothetical protein